MTGDLLGHEGTIISNNELVADHLAECSFVREWNAYDCETTDLAVLEFDAIGEDK